MSSLSDLFDMIMYDPKKDTSGIDLFKKKKKSKQKEMDPAELDPRVISDIDSLDSLERMFRKTNSNRK